MREQLMKRPGQSKWRWISRLLGLTMLLCLPLSVQAEETKEDGKHISIETTEEFLAFADACRLDSYSVNLQVELEEDIDLTGIEFTAIPTFSGEFDGKDHVIRGLSLETEGSVQGLFRYVREDAVIQNLNLEGTIAPTGSRSSVGSLAGENAGTIMNCSFSGNVSGSDRVGGLVGYNALTGIMEACSVNGQIQGFHFVGGLAGENNGVIRQSRNAAAINTAVQDNEVDLGDISLESVLESESAVTVTDVGGIAGTNMGVIRECENNGNVGYEKMGYNLGGIAGSQSGYIVDCVNRGQIQGRKEVGGIVGQMEPTLRMKFDEDTLQKLQVEMDTMMGLTGETMSLAQNGVHSQVAQLEKQVKDAEKALTEMLEEVEVPESLEEIELPENLEEIELPELSRPDEDALKAVQNNLSSSIGRLSGTMNDMMSSTQNTIGAFQSNMQAISGQMGVIGSTIQNAEEDLGGSIVDVSDADTEEETGGKVEDCQNYGEVAGDRNVGGIVGAMSFESSLDPELDVEIVGNRSLNFEGEVRAVVRQCQNYASVTVNKQNGGGIAGHMSLGLVHSCENRGDLQGASYVGGIAGRGDGGYLRTNRTRSRIEGSEYVGGIAGTAMVVSDCYSITQFGSHAEKIGGVLGSVEEVTEEIRENYYLAIDGDLGGVDGISYENRAQALASKEFFALQQMPEDFQRVTVRFVFADGSETVVDLDYGEVLKAEKIPAVPEQDGSFGRWEGIEELEQALYFDVTLEAAYDAFEKILAAENLRADGRPILLAGSNFGKDAQLKMSELSEGPVSVRENETTVEAWSVEATTMGDGATLRYLPPDAYTSEDLSKQEARILVKDASGVWRDAAYTVDGSYLIFDIEAQDNGFCLILPETASWWMYVLVGGGVLIVAEAIGLIVMLRRRKTMQKKREVEV